MLISSREMLGVFVILWYFTQADGGFFQLARMMRYLNQDAKLLDLARYGNFCGVGGQGMPLDGVDRCCKEHDLCYTQVMNEYCKGVWGLLVPYHWSKVNNKSNTEKDVNCTKNPVECSQRVCQCDRKLGFCFQNMLKAYREDNVRGAKGLLGVFTSLIPEAGLAVIKRVVKTLSSGWHSSQPTHEMSTPTEAELEHY